MTKGWASVTVGCAKAPGDLPGFTGASIQFFSKKDKFQEELFHLFNALHDANKQIIFSSDKHPHFITGLEDRLKSRLSAGMVDESGYLAELEHIAETGVTHQLAGIAFTAVVAFVAFGVAREIREEVDGGIDRRGGRGVSERRKSLVLLRAGIACSRILKPILLRGNLPLPIGLNGLMT